MNTNTHLLIQKSDQGQILRLENKTAKVYNDLSTVSRKIPVMLNGFEKIVEERIRKAQKKGELDHLPGSGRPFSLDNEPRIPEELRLAYKILKNAGFIPPEIELKKKIRQTEDLFIGMKETAEKYRILKKLNFLILKLNSTRHTSAQFDFPQQYSEKLVNRFGSNARIDPKG